jgi:hypothetical protein
VLRENIKLNIEHPQRVCWICLKNGGEGERERKNMGIILEILRSEDVSLSKRMVYKREITTKEGDLVILQVYCPPKQIWSVN